MDLTLYGITKSEKQAYSLNRGPHVNVNCKVDITADKGEKQGMRQRKELERERERERLKMRTEDRDE